MTKTKALLQIAEGIRAAEANEIAPNTRRGRKAYLKRSLELIEEQRPARLAGQRVFAINTKAGL